MAATKQEINETYLTNRIGREAKKKFNILYYDLTTYAISNGLAEPSKGELMAKLIENGAIHYANNQASYFKKKA